MKIQFFKNICLSMAFIFIMGVSGNLLGASKVMAAEGAEAKENPAFFEARVSEPARENVYFYEDNSYFKGGYGMPNCTAYAWGRAYEILGSQPNLPMGNGRDWWGKNSDSQAYATGSTPKLGAIICWGGGASGHVAVVEGIEGDQVTYSESAWSGPIFTTDHYTIGSEESISVGGFQGYIYIGDFIDAATDMIPPEIKNLLISEVDEEGFTISAHVEDEGTGIEKVVFPVWTTKEGQDDLSWYEAKIEGNIASRRVLYSDHKAEKGDYNVHVYAYDKANLSAQESIQKTAIINYRSSSIAKRILNDKNRSFKGI